MSELAALVPGLPLPLAQLLRRALNSHSPLELHHNAYYLAEAALKLSSAARIGLWLERALQPGHRVAARLEALAYPSLGHWRDFLRDIDRDLAVRADACELPLGGQLGRLGAQRDDWLAVSTFTAACAEAGAISDSVGASACREGLLGFFDVVVSYRNRVIAHGGQRLSSYYERMGDLLLQALGEVLRCESLLGELRLVYARLRLSQADEDPALYWQDLRGAASLPFDAQAAGIPAAVEPQRSMAGRVCLLAARGVVPLHPLVIYRIDEAGRESFGFLNRTIRRPVKAEAHPQEVRRADYLDYATGENVSGMDTRAALTALIGRLRGTTVTAEDLTAAQDVSAADGEPESAPDAAGKGVTIGDFEVLAEIGRGGMGVVYRARQCSLNRQVALKVLPPSLAGDANMLRRFRREIAALARCDHPNVIKILTSGLDAERYYYAMELVDGADLARLGRVLSCWRKGGALPREAHLGAAVTLLADLQWRAEESGRGWPEPPAAQASDDKGDWFARVAELFADAASGLDHLHGRGILHRDLKPSNLQLTADAGRLVVMDLGLARVHEASQTSSRSGSRILGTLRYAAPEQLVRRMAEVDYRADIYGLGASLYELLTGRPMFDGETESRLIRQILYESPPAPRQLEPRIPAALAAILGVATAREPASRYPSAAALAADLRAFAQGRPPEGAMGWRLRPAFGLARRRPLALAAALVATTALSAGGLALWARERVQVRTCAELVRKWEVPTCVRPLPNASHRHVSFRFHEQRGRVLRIERINGSGSLAAGEEGEARWDLSYSESGKLALVASFDPQGTPQQLWAYSSDLTRLERRDPSHNPKVQEGTELSVYRLEFDAAGFRRAVAFNNIYGYPVADKDGSFGQVLLTDGQGRVVAIEHLEAHGRAGPTRQGVVRETMLLDAGGNERERRLLGAAGTLVAGPAGVAGWRTAYDANDNPVERHWLGADGQRTLDADGVAGWRAQWDAHGNRVRESYFGLDGSPAWHRDGHAGWSARHDDRGHELEITFVDPEGKPVTTRDGFATRRSRHDSSGRLLEESYLDAQGAAVTSAAGYARRVLEYEGRGLVERERWLDPAGKPAWTRAGYAGWRAEYDERGNEVLRVLLGGDGQPALSAQGYAGWRTEHDERGTQVKITYLGTDLRLGRHAYGYSIVRTVYNARGERVESSFFDAQDRPVRTVDGYATVRWQHDWRAGQVEESYWGPDGRPALHRRGYFVARMRLDERGNKVHEAWLGLDGAPVVSVDGHASWTASFDARGREVEVSYFDAAGQPGSRRLGHARRTQRRDERGHVLEEAYFDAAGQPVALSDGYARWVATYGPQGQLLEQQFLGVDGRPALHRNGYSLRRYAYDERGNRVEVSWWLPDGGAASVGFGYARVRTQFDQAGREVAEEYLDAQGAAVCNAQGVGGRKLRHDEKGRVVEVERIGAQRAVLERRGYDPRGGLASVTFWSLQGEPGTDEYGVATILLQLDERGQRLGAACLGPDGKVVGSSDTCAASAAEVRDGAKVLD